VKALLVSVVLALSIAAGSVAAQPSSDNLRKIKSAGAIDVAYSPDSLPFSFSSADNAPAGYSIELCKRVIAQIGRTVGEPNLKVNWLPGSVTERLQMIASGRAELDCANTSQTLARLASVDFSNLIFIDGGGFLVIAGSPVNELADLSGKRIAVMKGTTTETSLNDALRRRLVNATVVTIADAAAGIAMLEAGSIDAYAGDKVKLVGLATQAKDPAKIAMLADEISFAPYAFALPRNDSAFRLEVNKALARIYGSEELDRIFGQWLGKLGRPSPLLAAMYRLNMVPE
jgi:ABC-type amino acid transport substrate-binding protein